MKDTTELELEIMELEEQHKLSRNETDKLVLHETIMKKKAELAELSKEKPAVEPAKPVINNDQKPAEKKEEDKKPARGEITNSGNTFNQNKDKDNKSEEKKN